MMIVGGRPTRNKNEKSVPSVCLWPTLAKSRQEWDKMTETKTQMELAFFCRGATSLNTNKKTKGVVFSQRPGPQPPHRGTAGDLGVAVEFLVFIFIKKKSV